MSKTALAKSVWYNYPIILCGVALQYIWAIALAWDASVFNVTAIHVLLPHIDQPDRRDLMNFGTPVLFRWFLVAVLTFSATLAIYGFKWRRKLHTLLSFLPQQFIMLLSSGAAIHAMVVGHFADGVIRSNAFLFADQSPTIVLVIFHTWAMILICLHAEPWHNGKLEEPKWNGS